MESMVQAELEPKVHPFYYVLAQGLVAAATIYHTKNKSILRLPALAVILWLAYLEFIGSVDYGSKGFGNSTITACSFLYTAQLVNIVWINSVSLDDFKAAEVPIKGVFSRYSFLSILHLVAFNFRGIRTPWRTKNIPPFSRYYPQQIPPSRVQFLTRNIAILAFQYLFLDAFVAQTLKFMPEDRNRLMGPGLEFAYLSATREQWIFRILSTIGAQWFINRCFLCMMYNGVSILGVATGLFSAEDYPPFMGSIWSSYTLRGYWGKFWHQTLRWPHTAVSSYITEDVLRLPKPSLLERYSNIFIAFTLSGILHVFIDLGNGQTDLKSTMLFFQSFSFGIMMEDSVQALWRSVTGEKFADRDDYVPMWKKFVGFIWVFAFFSMVGPLYNYPAARMPPDRLVKMPLNMTELIGAKGVGTTLVVLGLVLRLVFKVEV